MPLMEITGGKNLLKQPGDAVSPVVVGKRIGSIDKEGLCKQNKKSKDTE